ncbi:ArsR/SmtB family transcription factor [Streptomyces violens]|uniref:ArsR/SmtB family transcription factor n=1 Tax=Streptomyces violens TaxID=66377 RepID=UPI0004C0C90B|nr:winged helix-turn-helix domain-containing protein [Streptomyces violens]
MTDTSGPPEPASPAVGEPDLARLADLIGVPSRARILLALADGRALPASLLARSAKVAPSTVSEQLAKLVDGGLLRVEAHGRHRYYRLAGPEVAEALETLAALSGHRDDRPGQLRTLSWARTCYDHLAGKLGVALMRALLDLGCLAGGNGLFDSRTAVCDRLSAPGKDLTYELTATGRRLLVDELGVALPNGRRPLVRYCVDWSEQAHHLSGALGAELLRRFVELGWVRRYAGRRTVSVTRLGEQQLPERLGMHLPGQA